MTLEKEIPEKGNQSGRNMGNYDKKKKKGKKYFPFSFFKIQFMLSVWELGERAEAATMTYSVHHEMEQTEQYLAMQLGQLNFQVFPYLHPKSNKNQAIKGTER